MNLASFFARLGDIVVLLMYLYPVGRIVIVGDNAPDGTPKCFTIINPSASTGPWYAKAAPCTSDTKPSLGQTFGYGNDFGNVIFWVRLRSFSAVSSKKTAHHTCRTDEDSNAYSCRRTNAGLA